MEELVRQLVATLEEMHEISGIELADSKDWREEAKRYRESTRNLPDGQDLVLGPDEGVMRRMNEHIARSRASHRASIHAQRLELNVFRMLRDLSRDESKLRAADRVWDLMEERRAIGILDPGDDLSLPEPPELSGSASYDDALTTEYVQGAGESMRGWLGKQEIALDAIIARRDELLSQALAEARAMLG